MELKDGTLTAEESPLVEYYRSCCSLLARRLQQMHHARIGTLGPEGTSSADAVKHLLSALRLDTASVGVVLFPDFAKLHEALQSGDVDYAVFPNAHPGINNVYMSDSIWLEFVFIHATPRYGLAGRKSAVPQDRRPVIALHPATRPLLQYLDLPADVREVSSTAEAARQASTGDADLALTNATCIHKFELTVVKWFWPIRMLWSVFRKRAENG